MQSMPYYQQGYQAPYQNAVVNSAPMLGHSNGLPPMQHAGLPDPMAGQPPKRKQVKNACTNCQKACKKCDDARPCPRCVKYGIADTCVNSVRKERKKGIKRGPYKRRQKSVEKIRKAEGTDSNGQYAPAMRSGIPFGYPGNLNQYNQPYDPYNQYAAYHKEQMMSQPYVVNPYPPMGYPVMVASSATTEQQQQQQNTSNGQPQHQPQSHPYPYMMHQQQPSPQSATTALTMARQQQPDHYPAQVYYQPQQQPQQQQQQHQQPQSQSQPASQRNSPHLPDIKPEETFSKPRVLAAPSSSTSTTTTHSPDSSWVPPHT